MHRRLTTPICVALLAVAGTLIVSPARAIDDPPNPQGRPDRPQRPEGRPEGKPDGRPDGAPNGDRPGARRGREGGPAGNRPMIDDPKAMRDALSRLAEHLRAVTPRLDKAIADLDAGKDMSEIRRELATQRGEGFGAMVDTFRVLGLIPGQGGGPQGRRPDGDRPDGPDFDGPGPGGPGPGGPGGPDGGPPGPRKTFYSMENPKVALDALREFAPATADQIESLRKQQQREGDRLLGSLLPKLNDIKEHSQRDPRLADYFRKEIVNIVDVLRARREYHEARRNKAEPAKIAAMEQNLRAALAAQWDLRQQLDEHQVRQLQERIERIKQDQAKRAGQRDAQIDDRLKAMTAEPDRPRPDRNGPPDQRRGKPGEPDKK